MYSTVIRQQHMIDRTEQDRLFSFIALKYYKTKGAEWCSWNNTESQRADCAAEKKSTEGRDIDEYCIKSVRSFIEPFLLTGLNLSDCALEESLTVVTERNAQFACWVDDDR